jgi:hypothetical protein
MAEFARAAFPWVAMGIAIAVVLNYWNKNEKKHDKKES